MLERAIEEPSHFSAWMSPEGWSLATWMIVFRPFGAVLMAALALLLEVVVAGYERSSIQRLLNPSPSAKVDLFFFLIYLSNLKVVFGTLFSLGFSQFIYFWLLRHSVYHPLVQSPFLFSLAVLFLVNNVVYYWFHRIEHSALFWPLHKVHHSATELLMITTFRAHPVNITVLATVYAITAALLGVRPEVEVIFLALNGAHQLWAHSAIDWKLHEKGLGFIQDWILIASEEHRLHHSKQQEHFNKNFGLNPFLDKLFGTWMDSRDAKEPIILGLDDEKDMEMLASHRGLFSTMKKFLRLA